MRTALWLALFVSVIAAGPLEARADDKDIRIVELERQLRDAQSTHTDDMVKMHKQLAEANQALEELRVASLRAEMKAARLSDETTTAAARSRLVEGGLRTGLARSDAWGRELETRIDRTLAALPKSPEAAAIRSLLRPATVEKEPSFVGPARADEPWRDSRLRSALAIPATVQFAEGMNGLAWEWLESALGTPLVYLSSWQARVEDMREPFQWEGASLGAILRGVTEPYSLAPSRYAEAIAIGSTTELDAFTNAAKAAREGSDARLPEGVSVIASAGRPFPEILRGLDALNVWLTPHAMVRADDVVGRLPSGLELATFLDVAVFSQQCRWTYTTAGAPTSAAGKPVARPILIVQELDEARGPDRPAGIDEATWLALQQQVVSLDSVPSSIADAVARISKATGRPLVVSDEAKEALTAMDVGILRLRDAPLGLVLRLLEKNSSEQFTWTMANGRLVLEKHKPR